MQKSIAIVATMLLMMLFSTSDAEARKVPIPCTGEHIVKVLDIPMLAGVAGRKKLDLGYKFKYCFSGEWVGHIGDDSSYLPLNPMQLQLLLAAAGLKQPPPTPSVFNVPDIIILLVIGGLLLAFALFKSRQAKNSRTYAAPAPQQSADQGSEPQVSTSAMRAIEAAAQQHAAAQAAKSQGARSAMPARPVQNAARASFGRRQVAMGGR